jgi:type II secretory pathway component PulK
MSLVLAITLLSVMIISISGLLMHLLSSIRETQRELAVAQTFQIADAGLNLALARWTQNPNYRGEKSTAFAGGRFEVEVKGDTVFSTSHWTTSSRDYSQTLSVQSKGGKWIHWQQSRLILTRLATKNQ